MSVTTTGNSSTSSSQDLTIDVDCSGIDNNYVVVPNSESRRYCIHTTSEAPTRSSGSRRGENEPPPSGIRLSLQEEELWQEFYAVGNEMIVTKPGRRMYPYVVVTPHELKTGVQYVVVLRVVPVDNKRYKYTNGVWHAVGGSDAIVDSTRMSFKHPTTPALGEHLNGKPLIFKHAKLTHIRENKEHILVRTMHKYLAVIDVAEVGEPTPKTTSFLFVETTFIAVTSYLSSQLTGLKIRHNPFARGIQDRAQLSITNGDSDYTDEDDDILPPILSSNPSSLLTSNIALPYLPLVPLPPPQQTSSTSSSYVPPLPPTLSVSQIFSYTSASSYSQPSSCISTPSQSQPSCISASNYISTFTLPPPVPVPTPFPFCVPAAVSSDPQESSSSGSNSASGSGQTQNSSLVARLPQWSSYFPATTTSLMPITSYITTPSGRHHFYSQVSWPYPYPPIPHRALHRLPSTESFKMPTLHPYIPYPSSAAPYYPRTTTIPHPVYYNTNYRPNMQ